ncbi:MAG: DHH family phosphoesterase, partial [Desulfovibrio sp.]|nr:DHH family phosphoesterase [Desulfovibrio sp.]
MPNPLLRVEDALASARRVLVATHITPDGDAVGSAAALARIAQHLGCEARLLLPGGMPPAFSWLSLSAAPASRVSELDGFTPDLLAFVDCGDASRAGPELDAFVGQKRLPDTGWEHTRTLNIDHHLSNPLFADINWVEADSAATGELVGRLAEHLGISLAGSLGEALYLALVTDTGNFTYSNTGPACLGMAARIVASGLDVAAFTDKSENTWRLERMHLWGRLFAEVTLHAHGAVARCAVPRSYLAERGLDNQDLEGLASWLRRIRGVRVSLFLREEGPALCKISLRSMGDFDVRAVAALYGGGGHASAAGANVELPLAEAAETVLREIESRL